MFVNKHFINTGAYISKGKKFYNAKPSAYYFYMRMNISLNFRICLSVSLMSCDALFKFNTDPDQTLKCSSLCY